MNQPFTIGSSSRVAMASGIRVAGSMIAVGASQMIGKNSSGPTIRWPTIRMVK